MKIKNLMSKAVGLFVETGPISDPAVESTDLLAPESAPEPPKTIEQIVAAAPGPKLEEIQVSKESVEQPVAVGGKPDFNRIYNQAGVPVVAFGANEVLDVIHSLPADLAIEVRRKAVQSTLGAMGKAMGVSTESVVTDATRKLKALESYSEKLQLRAEEFAVSTEAAIAELEKQIATHRQTLDENKKMLSDAIASCEAESDRIDDILEFFSLDIAPSKNAPDQTSQ